MVPLAAVAAWRIYLARATISRVLPPGFQTHRELLRCCAEWGHLLMPGAQNAVSVCVGASEAAYLGFAAYGGLP